MGAWGKAKKFAAYAATLAFVALDFSSPGLSFAEPSDQVEQIVPNSIAGISVVDADFSSLNGCMVTSVGDVFCWGLSGLLIRNDDRFILPVSEPTKVDLGIDAVSVSVGEYSACALSAEGEAECWGNRPYWNFDFQNALANLRFSEIEVGPFHGCGITQNQKDVYCWGTNYDGESAPGYSSFIDTPTLVSGLSAQADKSHLALGVDHSCVVQGDSGQVMCWGGNSQGQQGGQSSSYPSYVSSLTGITNLTAGNYFTCAEDNSGNVHCWGQGHSGQLGNGENEQSSVPVLAGVEIASGTLEAGGYGVCAINELSEVICWGDYAKGQNNNSLPAEVDVFSNIDATDVFMGQGIACALDDDLYCTGENYYGQLGRGFFSGFSAEPVSQGVNYSIDDMDISSQAGCGFAGSVLYCWGSDNAITNPGGFFSDDEPLVFDTQSSAISSIAAASHSACLTNQAGELVCWGRNYNGQLGIDSNNFGPFDFSEVEPNKSWDKVFGGGSSYCAVDDAGDLYCWGNGYSGQLGIGSNQDSYSPVKVNGPTQVQKLHMTDQYACAIDGDGQLWCWGSPNNGLGDGTNSSSNVPVRLYNDFDAVDIDGNYSARCAASDTGDMYCWGTSLNRYGLGNSQFSSSIPIEIATSSDVVDLSMGSSHLCYSDSNDNTYCSGYSASVGQTANSDAISNTHNDEKLDLRFSSLELSENTSCGLTDSGEIYCWGDNSNKLVTNSETYMTDAVPVAFDGRSIGISSSISGTEVVGQSLTAEISIPDDVTGDLIVDYSWFDNDGKIHGAGSTLTLTDDLVGQRPRVVVELYQNFEMIYQEMLTVSDPVLPADSNYTSRPYIVTTGDSHSCAINSESKIECWGGNDRAQLGIGMPYANFEATELVLTNAVAIDAGGSTTCAITEDGELYCWGDNSNGQAIPGSFQNTVTIPTKALQGTFVSVSVGANHTCAINESGDLLCWGDNSANQLGNASDIQDGVLTHSLPAKVIAVSAGDSHTCAITEAGGSVYCWGSDSSGQLGNGSSGSQSSPQLIANSTSAIDIEVSANHSCFLDSDKDVFCWGSNTDGKLGIGSSDSQLSSSTSPADLSLSYPVDDIFVSDLQTCISSGGEILCAGADTYGNQLNASGSDSPIEIGLGGVSSFSSDSAHNCVSGAEGVRCWGLNEDWQVTGNLAGIAYNSLQSVQGLSVASFENLNVTVQGTPQVGGTLYVDDSNIPNDADLNVSWKVFTPDAQTGVFVNQPSLAATGTQFALTPEMVNSQVQASIYVSASGYEPYSEITAKSIGLGVITLPDEFQIEYSVTDEWGYPEVGSTATLAGLSQQWKDDHDYQVTWSEGWPGHEEPPVVGESFVISQNSLNGAPIWECACGLIEVGITVLRDGYQPYYYSDLSFVNVDRLTVPATPQIQGSAYIGQTLTAAPGEWGQGVEFEYQWMRGARPIEGANQATYQPTVDDLSKEIWVIVTGTKPGFAPTKASSTETEPVRAAENITVSTEPVISGTLSLGGMLSADVGKWDRGVQFDIQWFRDSEPIEGETTWTYQLKQEDINKVVSVGVTGTILGDALFVNSALGVMVGEDSVQVVQPPSDRTPEEDPEGDENSDSDNNQDDTTSNAGGGGGGGGFIPLPQTNVPNAAEVIVEGSTSGVMVGGQPAEITPVQDALGSEVSYKVGGIELSLKPSGWVEEDGRMMVEPDSPTIFSGQGYQPGSSVVAQLTSFESQSQSMQSQTLGSYSTQNTDTPISQSIGDFVVDANGAVDSEIVVPNSMPEGEYALTISGSSTSAESIVMSVMVTVATPEFDDTFAPWTKRMIEDGEETNQAKFYAKNVVGKGKIQFFLNGEEIAWVRTEDPRDSKLRLVDEGRMKGSNYLVRTADLKQGKNVLEIYQDGERVRRTIYTGR